MSYTLAQGFICFSQGTAVHERNVGIATAADARGGNCFTLAVRGKESNKQCDKASYPYQLHSHFIGGAVGRAAVHQLSTVSIRPQSSSTLSGVAGSRLEEINYIELLTSPLLNSSLSVHTSQTPPSWYPVPSAMPKTACIQTTKQSWGMQVCSWGSPHLSVAYKTHFMTDHQDPGPGLDNR